MKELQDRLTERFRSLSASRRGPVFFIEHGLSAGDLNDLHAGLRDKLRNFPLESDWWDDFDLPLLVAAAEEGYKYRGSGTDFWPLIEAELGFEALAPRRQRIKDLFAKAAARFRGATPASTAWTGAFHLISWPIAHALLPLEFHLPFALTLADVRVNVSSEDDAALYRAILDSGSGRSTRFDTLLKDSGVVVALTRSVLNHDPCGLSWEIVSRIITDLEADQLSRRGVAVARTNQRARKAPSGGALTPAVNARLRTVRTRGTFQLRRTNGVLLLEACFPALEPSAAEQVRRSVRRRRFAPQLWGVTARVPSDQILSGLPFALKLITTPSNGAPLFPNLEEGGFDAYDLAILQSFELELNPPHVFAVGAHEDIARQVFGSTISGHRKYWVLQNKTVISPVGGLVIGGVGPLECVELDPSTDDGKHALAQLGFDVRWGVAVRFAGVPSIEPGANVPTFVSGDPYVLVPQRLPADSTLAVDLDGQKVNVTAMDALRFTVGADEHWIQVSSETDTRTYGFRGIPSLPPQNVPLTVEMRSEERTIQALLRGHLGFQVFGIAPVDGLRLTIEINASGRSFSATGELGTLPEWVTSEHAVMCALLGDDVRAHVATAEFATLRVRIGHVAGAAWRLERVVRPCWWDTRGEPQLQSELGPLRFGVVSTDDPIRVPIEGTSGSGTYLLAPIRLDQSEFGATASFTTLCLAPNRSQLHDLTIPIANKPKLERRRRGTGSRVGLEDLAEAYLRWTLAETQNVIGEFHRGQVTTRIEGWMTEICCGPAWTHAESTISRRTVWGLLEQVFQELQLGYYEYAGRTDEQIALFRRFAVEEIRRAVPDIWDRIAVPLKLDDSDSIVLDHACDKAYQELSARYLLRGQVQLAKALSRADPGETTDKWNDAFSRVRERSEFHELAAMLIPSRSATRLMALNVAEMSVDDVAEELERWAKAERKSFAGDAPPRDLLKASYALWVAPELALSLDWRSALDTLVAERAVARATRYLALRARQVSWGHR